MKRLVPIPAASAERLKKEKQTRLGYQFVSVKLKDGRYFEQAVASERPKWIRSNSATSRGTLGVGVESTL